jgi:hypothetical protein
MTMDGADAELEIQGPAPVPVIGAQAFEEATGEALSQVLDLATWRRGEDLAALYGRLEQVVAEAVRQENRIREQIRARIFPRLRERPGAPPNAGVYRLRVEDIERIHRTILFNGLVEACDGASVMHDTLPLTIAQIGVCLVSYQGDQGSWVHRLFRRDLTVGGMDPIEETLEMLERRRRRTGYDQSSPRDTLSDLGRRAIMAYAERAVLLRMSKVPWLMGHGNPTPYELLTGSGMVDLLTASLNLLYSLVIDRQRFVFVPSAAADRTLLTIGDALRPLEFAIVDTATDDIDSIVRGHYRGEWGAGILADLRAFMNQVGPHIVKGVYRASAMAPAQVFYAHDEHAGEAAAIALADSTFMEHRGFPALIDLADTVCRGTFDPASFTASAHLAYVEAGEAYRYLAERQTRRG